MVLAWLQRWICLAHRHLHAEKDMGMTCVTTTYSPCPLTQMTRIICFGTHSNLKSWQLQGENTTHSELLATEYDISAL